MVQTQFRFLISDATPSHRQDDPAPRQPPDPATAARFRELVAGFQRSMALRNAEQTEAALESLMTFVAAQPRGDTTPEEEVQARINGAERRFEWDEAVRLRRKLIEAERQKPENDTTWLLFLTLDRLGGLLLLLGRTQEALRTAEEALVHARSQAVYAAVAKTALTAAQCALALGDPQRALQRVEEARAALDAARKQELPVSDLSVGSTLLVRARCLVALGELAAAEADLAEAWPPLEGLSDSEVMLGIQSRIGDYWEITGLIHQARGEISGALEALEKALAQRAGVQAIDDHTPHIAVYKSARSLRTYAELLDSADRPGEAAEVRKAICAMCESVRLPLPATA